MQFFIPRPGIHHILLHVSPTAFDLFTHLLNLERQTGGWATLRQADRQCALNIYTLLSRTLRIFLGFFSGIVNHRRTSKQSSRYRCKIRIGKAALLQRWHVNRIWQMRHSEISNQPQTSLLGNYYCFLFIFALNGGGSCGREIYFTYDFISFSVPADSYRFSAKRTFNSKVVFSVDCFVCLILAFLFLFQKLLLFFCCWCHCLPLGNFSWLFVSHYCWFRYCWLFVCVILFLR